ncbi:hypothetical protein TNCV_1867121 [Trichonephila clavipes]|nr:hypothetical protein TNCV_1867121 [Trichonephila clavipes]
MTVTRGSSGGCLNFLIKSLEEKCCYSVVLCEGDTRNRWRDGQVCPDVRQGTMAPWARRLGRRPESPGERTDGRRRRVDGRERRRDERRRQERWRKGLSPEIGVKKTMNPGGVENGNMN